ncbi:MAG: hypothetical protein MJA84_00320 [Firmicutes bacterium]|nr:hypothetical protein [Bacillota bacterium]
MRIGLIDLGNKFPNLALMKVSTYHKAMHDTVSLGHGGDLTYISCVFSKYRNIAEELLNLYPAAVVGGPGWDHTVSLPPEIEDCRPDYSLYGIDYGLGRLTAGCPGDCPWCVVPACEGTEAKTVATAGDIVNPRGDFLVLLDANILACPDWPDHFREIRERGLTVCFSQGLDIRYVNDMVAAELAKLKVSDLRRNHNRLWFAWDRPENEEHVRAGVAALNKAGIKSYRLRFYVMVGYNTTWEQDWHRFAVLRDLGAEPFIMCYEGSNRKLRAFARWVNRFIYKRCRWEDNNRWGEDDERQQVLCF